MPHRLLLLFFGLALSGSARAQMERTIYQVFNVDSAQTVEIDLADIYDIYSWSGSDILIETNIRISYASPDILDFLIKQGRYDARMDTLSVGTVRISTLERKRKPVKTSLGECTEIPEAKIFVPDTFVWTDDKKTLTRKPK